ncbi:MAG: efflux RND transporter permease subunit, partial [Holophagales bacterium]|nr:efflux RND transporter permease subunit [Holophagales bacterium]
MKARGSSESRSLPSEVGRSEPRPGSITTLFYRNPYLLGAAILVLAIGSISAFLTLPRLEDPRIEQRNASVVTPVPGASAERVDTLVTEVLEQALQEVPEVLHLESSSRAGVSVISIELEAAVDDSDNKEIFSELRDRLSSASRLLPPEALDPIFDDQRGAVGFTLIVALYEDDPEAHTDPRSASRAEPNMGILGRLAEDLADRLRALEGTEIVRLYGMVDEEITVTVDPGRLADLGLSSADVARRIAAADAKGSAGVLRAPGSDLQLEVEGELDSLGRVAKVPLLAGAGGEVTRLGDIARVAKEPRTPERELAIVDGHRSVLVAARTVPEVRVDRWATDARAALTAFAATAGGVRVDPIFEQERYTSRQLADLGGNLLAGAAVVIGVVLLMMGWRLALVVGAALPLVVASVHLGWQVSGNAVHQMSIFGLIIALGLLIDNAIVITDEVSRERAAGLPPAAAVDRAIRHLAAPLAASTLTTVLAFAPILLLPGNVGDFVGSIGSSVILAILASFAIALTITAALAGRVAVPPPQDGRRRTWQHGLDSGRWLAAYRRALVAAARRPGAALLVALFLPLSGFVVARGLGNEFFPPVDRDLFQVEMWLPVDASLEESRRLAQEAEQLVREMPGTERVFWLVGGSFPTVYYNLVMDQDDAPFYAHAIVQAESSGAAKAMIDGLQANFDRRFPQAQLVVRQFGQGPPIEADVELRLYGPELGRLQSIGEELRHALQQHPEVLVSRDSLPRGEPKLWLGADEDEARLAGFSLTEVAAQMRANLDGGVGGSVVEELERLDVRIRYGDERQDLDAVASMPLVRPGTGDWVPLEALGELELRPETGAITRYDGERTHRVQAWTRNDALPIDVTDDVLESLGQAGFELPPGYRLELGGAAAEDATAKAQLAKYVPVLAVLMVATLVLAFRSLRLASLLLCIATLSVGLGLLSTWSLGLPISFN